MEEILICPRCNGVDLDFARLGGARVRCFACRSVIQVEEKRIFSAAPDEGVAELHGVVVDSRAAATNPEWMALNGDLETSFPVDLYVSDDGFVCIRNYNEVVALSPEQAAGLGQWLQTALPLADARHRKVGSASAEDGA